jgi:molybdopterin/thiamine biosynthesis adenylyltransferase
MSLSGKTAVVVGAGGLGGPVLLTLAAAGVGRLVVVDSDAVETSNLARQVLFGEDDLGARKAVAAAARLGALFPTVKVEARDLRVGPENAPALAAEADLIVDGTDNFESKFLLSDAAQRARRPLVHGGVLRTTFQLLTINPTGLGGCLRCLFEAPPPAGAVPACADAGVLGAVAATAGALMGSEAIRLLYGERGAYEGRLLTYEARAARGRLVLVRRRAHCPGCSPEALAAAAAPAPATTAGAAAGGPGGAA